MAKRDRRKERQPREKVDIVRVQFLGHNDIYSRKGKVTGREYVFAGGDKICEMDARDAEETLTHTRSFKKVEKPKKIKVK